WRRLVRRGPRLPGTTGVAVPGVERGGGPGSRVGPTSVPGPVPGVGPVAVSGVRGARPRSLPGARVPCHAALGGATGPGVARPAGPHRPGATRTGIRSRATRLACATVTGRGTGCG